MFTESMNQYLSFSDAETTLQGRSNQREVEEYPLVLRYRNTCPRVVP